jgi:hypothetical protein
MGKGSGTVTVKLYLVGGPEKAVVGEDYGKPALEALTAIVKELSPPRH